MKVIKVAFFFAVLFCISGCGPFYAIPEGAQLETAASIKGTHIKTGALLADRRFFIQQIDGVLVKDAEDYADQPLYLLSGKHQLLARFEQGSIQAEADFPIELQPKQELNLLGTVDAENFLGGASRVTFTLVDAKENSIIGTPITKNTSAPVTTPVFISK